jgi:UDP-glucose 4-epimerase
MILVAGGAGFIGSHMVKRLEQEGEPFVVLDNLERGHLAALRGAPLVKADLRDRDSLRSVFARHDIDVVLHFAASIEVGESVKDPAAFWENNVVGSWNLLEAAREARVSQFVFSSTAAVYGEPHRTPLDEDHPTAPTNPYGDTKLAVERMLEAYEAAYGLRSVRLRYFNAAGADPDGELGEDHSPETHLIPRVLLKALGRAEFRIFGDDYPTRDGTCVRDYIHVSDLVEAHLGAVGLLRSGGGSAVCNLGNGLGYSVKEVVATVERVTGIRVRAEVAPRRPGDSATLVASSAKAKGLLGWRPRYPGLEPMIEHAFAWFKTHPNGYGD